MSELNIKNLKFQNLPEGRKRERTQTAPASTFFPSESTSSAKSSGKARGAPAKKIKLKTSVAAVKPVKSTRLEREKKREEDEKQAKKRRLEDDDKKLEKLLKESHIKIAPVIPSHTRSLVSRKWKDDNDMTEDEASEHYWTSTFSKISDCFIWNKMRLRRFMATWRKKNLPPGYR